MESEIDFRLTNSNICAAAFYKIMRAKEILRRTKRRFYKTLFSMDDHKNGTNKNTNLWRKNSVENFRSKKDPTIRIVIRSKRLQWLGDLERMEDKRILEERRWEDRIAKGREKYQEGIRFLKYRGNPICTPYIRYRTNGWLEY